MGARLLRVALVALAVALVLPASSRTLPTDRSFHNKKPAPARTFFLACPSGPTCEDLQVSKVDSGDPVDAGEPGTDPDRGLKYILTVRNHGPEVAKDVVITDFIPLPTTAIEPIVASDGTACTVGIDPDDPTHQRVTCEIGDLENTDISGFPITVTIPVLADGAGPYPSTGYPKVITDTAKVTARGFSFDRNPDNNSASETTTITSPGDLRLTKTMTPPSPVAVGSTPIFHLMIENQGAATTTTPVTVTDTLPHGFKFVAGASPAFCSATGEALPGGITVTCTRPATPGVPGGGGVVDVPIAVQPIGTGVFSNSAVVTKEGDDPNPNDNSTSLDNIQVVCPALSDEVNPALCVTKSDSPDPVVQGQPLTYSIGVKNVRTSTLKGPFTVVDTLPAGLTVLSMSAQGGTCVQTSPTEVSCTLNGDIASGATRAITIVVAAGASVTGNIENYACIEDNSCGITTTTVNPGADLAVTKTGPATANVGDDIVYTVVATNNGPSAMPNVTMTDTLPAGITFVSSNPSCPLADGKLTCALGTLAAGASKTITITVRAPNDGAFTNTATVTGDTSPNAPIDWNAVNNTAFVTTNALAADLSITKEASSDTVGVGQSFTYTLTVRNNGPGRAIDVTTRDVLAADLSFATATGTGVTCSGNQTITCSLGNMDSATEKTITITATPTAPGTISNTATVATSVEGLDDNQTNNSSSVDIQAIAADLAITKTATPDPVAVGTPLTYRLRVTNLGPDDATAVTIRDTLPSQVTLPSATASQGTCFGNPTVTCNIGVLPAFGAVTVTIVVTPIVAHVTITNSATVASAFDLNAANNSASVRTRVLDPRVILTPDLGPPGFVPLAVGTDFPPNSEVVITWRPGLGRQFATTTARGTFRVPMLVFPHDIIGPRDLQVSAGRPDLVGSAFLPVTTDFLVVSSSSEPFRVKPSFPVTQLVQRSG